MPSSAPSASFFKAYREATAHHTLHLVGCCCWGVDWHGIKLRSYLPIRSGLHSAHSLSSYLPRTVRSSW